MAIYSEMNERQKSVVDVAKKMLIAARTAPKGKGADNLEMAILTENDIRLLAMEMRRIGEQKEYDIFIRDADNILTSADAIVLIGSRIKTLGLKVCSLCGFADCATKEKYPLVPCVYNIGDLGIAVGSAVALAADCRVDNRIMHTAGIAALNLEIFSSSVKIIWGIPLSASSKNPFFDRKK
ncbi:MAG: ferredoxin domain-containing protein [Bacteroidales bacterium]